MDHNAPSTTFQVGDLVVARASEQGLIAGEYYTVTDLTFHAMTYGVYCAYEVEPAAGGERLSVRGLGQLVEHAEE